MTRDEVLHIAKICADRYRDKDGSLEIRHVCRGEGVRLFPYGAVREPLERIGLADVLGEKSGAAFVHGWNVFYDETLPKEEQRKAIARELARILLNALTGDGEDLDDDDVELFAETLLTSLSCTMENVAS